MDFFALQFASGCSSGRMDIVEEGYIIEIFNFEGVFEKFVFFFVRIWGKVREVQSRKFEEFNMFLYDGNNQI